MLLKVKLEQKLATMMSELGTQLKQAEETQVKMIISITVTNTEQHHQYYLSKQEKDKRRLT